jgi:hypothetical protein
MCYCRLLFSAVVILSGGRREGPYRCMKFCCGRRERDDACG